MSKIPLKACFSFIIAISVVSLIAGLIGQFVFNLPPCQMCIYQRIPFVAASIFGIAGLFGTPKLALTLSGLSFQANAVLAFYHTGIEQGWWQETAGCAANFGDGANNVLQRIMSAEAVSCADIPWVDPILGLSMANYNIILSQGMAAICLVFLLRELYQSK